MTQAAKKVSGYGFVLLAAVLGLSGCATMNVATANSLLREAQRHRDEAKSLYDQGSYEESAAEATKSLQSLKKSVELCASEPGCEQSFDEHSHYSEIYALRALAQIGLEAYPAALEDARAAVAEKQDSPAAHQALILALLVSGDREAARAQLPKARPLSADQEKYLGYLLGLPSAAAAEALKKQFYDRTPFARAMAAYEAENYPLALELWLPLAKKGDAAAQYNVGLLYQQGQGVQKDEAKAFEWYLLSALQGNVAAMSQAGTRYLYGQGIRKNGPEAAKWLQAAAEKGDAAAAYSLGVMLYEGREVAKNDQAAFRWMSQAAEAGHSDGQTMLGYMYENGLGVKPDPVQAVELYRQAAMKRNPVGQYNLAVMYANGSGTKKDEAEAARWYRGAADSGYERAVEGLRSMAEAGSAPAEYELASMLLEGRSLPPDDSQAVALLTRSADGNYAPALELLGELCLEGGRGVARDAARGERLLLAAAEQGRSGAKLLLAELYLSGQAPVKKDPVKAYMWYELALRGQDSEDLPALLLSLFDLSSGWFDASLAQEELAKTLTKSQIAEATRRAAQWEKQHPGP